MPNLTEAGQVETRPDGTQVFTHGHRYPDNVQVVTQEHDAQGQLVRARAEWSGLAGKVLDVSATFDASGKLLKEEGYRAPEMKTPVAELLRPLPASAGTNYVPQPAAGATSASCDAPITVPSLSTGNTAKPDGSTQPAQAAEDHTISGGLHQIYGDTRPNKNQTE